MKKFCSKITKQQWRVTVPNINSSIFKRSVSREKDDLRNSPRVKKSYSGCYDIEAAQHEFEQKTNVTNAIILENYSSDSESDGDYQDATAMSEKLSSTDELDTSVYADVELSPKSNRSSYINECCGDFEVPEISFSFFEERNHEYQDVKVQRKPELKIDKIEDEKTKPTEINEITIMLTEASPVHVKNRDILKLSKSTNNLFDSTTPKPKLPKYDFTKSLNSFPNFPRIMKSGSDPNISHSRLELDEDDGVYKVPGAVRRYRQSHSLNDFNMENVDLASSASSSIEHISCSQTIVNKDSDYCASSSNAMDYCETRKKMPNKKRKISFLRKPKSTAWINLRSKLDDMMTEHASKQRVGAFANRDGAINIEEMYKSSKNKCKKMLKTTGKMFQKPKKEQENVDNSVEETALPKVVPRTIKPSDIEVKLNIENLNSDVGDNSSSSVSKTDKSDKVTGVKASLNLPTTLVEEKLEDGEFHSLKNVFRRSKVAHETHSGFDDLRKYVKQGEDFCKELSTILQERSEAELQYAKSLSKLSVKLVRACRENVGGLNEAWRAVAVELEMRSEAHRMLGTVLLDEATRPLRALNENQYKVRKQTEIVVDKSAKTLSDWRTAEAKSKKHSHTCARENEKVQDHFPDGKLPKPIQPEKENTKLEGKKKKAEDAAKKADIEYYTLCVRAERARLEWESEILKGSDMFQILEEERLKNLKTVLCSYLQHVNELGPRLLEASERLSRPVTQADPGNDLAIFISYRNSLQQNYEQLLPDFYCEHITLAMNKERRKQALEKLLQLFKQDIDRENKSKNGLEKLTQAITQTPNFGNDDSQQNVSEKIYHMESMLMYLEGAKYKVQNALTELDGKPKIDHPLASYIIVMRDKSGLQQSILKVPQWLKDQMMKPENTSESKIPVDRTKADGSSDESESGSDEIDIVDIPLEPIAQCKALYTYKRNLDDELCLHPGDVLSVYRKQEDGWWLGECKGSVGIFPATYVEIIQT